MNQDKTQGMARANAAAQCDASIQKFNQLFEGAHAHGVYHAVCVGPKEEHRAEYESIFLDAMKYVEAGMGHIAQSMLDAAAWMTEPKWSEEFPNVVTTVGKNYALDTFLAGSGFTVVGPYLGLCNGGASAAAVGDTMGSHAGWTEVGNTNAPTYTSPRKTVTWSAASGGNKASSGTMTFNITSNGTVGGCFLVSNTNASNVIDNANGTLYSAGAFTGGNKTVQTSDSLTVTYTAGL